MTTDTLAALLLLVVIGTTVWVGFDSSSHGQTGGEVLGWMIGCLLLWIVVFPAYVVTRGKWHRDAQRDLIQSAAAPGGAQYSSPPMAPTPRRSGALRWLGIGVVGFVCYLASALSTTFVDEFPASVRYAQMGLTLAFLLTGIGGLVMMVVSLVRQK